MSAASDVVLVVEVADTTLTYDREVKVPLYARHDVPEVWIVDLEKRLIERYRIPRGGEFLECSVVSVGERLDLHAFGARVDFAV